MPGFFDSYMAGKQQRVAEQDQQVQRQRQDEQYGQSQQDRQHKQVAQAAMYLHSLPPERRAAAYRGFVPMVRAAFPGEQIPDEYDMNVEGALDQIVMMSGGGANTGPGVQSTFVDSRGVRMGVMRDGSVRELGQNEASFKPIQGEGGVYGFDPRSNTAAPTMVGGGQPQQGPAQGPQQPRVAFDFAPGTSPEVMAAMRDYAAADRPGAVEVPPARQLQPAPKPTAQRAPPSGYNWTATGGLEVIPGGPAQIALDAKQSAADAKATAGQVRQAEAAGQASGLVTAIDRLTSSSGFGDLGTTWGDIEQGVPLLRTDAKDAQAQLKNVAGQVALTTMSRLKALSATGATGFGSLTAPELKLLENSIATLQSDQISNKELTESLKIIRDTMQKVADWKDGASAPAGGAPKTKYKVGQVIAHNGKQYRVTGGDLNDDPDVEEAK